LNGQQTRNPVSIWSQLNTAALETKNISKTTTAWCSALALLSQTPFSLLSLVDLSYGSWRNCLVESEKSALRCQYSHELSWCIASVDEARFQVEESAVHNLFEENR